MQSGSSSMRVEPFDAMFWDLGILLPHILQRVNQPAGLSSLNRGSGMVLYSRGQ